MPSTRHETENRAYIDWLKEITGNEFNEEQEEAILELNTQAVLVPKQLYQWVGHTLRLAESLANDPIDLNEASLFWIRLQGIFDEVVPYLKRLTKIQPGADGGFIARFDELRALLLEGEMTAIDYLRQTNAHPVPHMLYVKGKYPKLDWTYKGKNIAELRRQIDEVMTQTAKEYGVPIYDAETYLARSIARKISLPLSQIYENMCDWINAR